MPTTIVTRSSKGSELSWAEMDQNLENLKATADAALPATGGTITGDLTVSAGNLVIGTAGKGIDFSATSDATGSTSELLNDYEEGYHIATVTPSVSGTVTLRSDRDLLRYTKVGRLVHVEGRIDVDTVSSPSGYFTISLPFSIGAGAEKASQQSAVVVVDGLASGVVGEIVSHVASSSIYVRGGASTNFGNATAEQLQAATSMYISVTYPTTT